MSVIRPIVHEDREALVEISRRSGLFSEEELEEVAGTIDAFLRGELPDGHAWVTHADDSPAGVAYFAPEVFSDGVWNLYMLAVAPDAHGQGAGAALVEHVAGAAREGAGRILLVETSGNASFERTRSFYEMCGFVREATIRDYYGPGDDKVVYWMSLS